MVIPPRRSTNKSLLDGSAHCLVYCGTDFQPEVEAQNARQRPVARGRLRHKVIQKKRTGDRSSSRSRSRSPECGGLEEYCVDPALPYAQPLTMEQVVTNPTIEIAHQHFHSYVESHSADLTIIKQEINRQNICSAKILCCIEVASVKKTWCCGNDYRAYLEQNTEQVVQELFAAISSRQTCIFGLLIIADGIKIVEITFNNNRYCVKETELIKWNQPNTVLEILNYIDQKLV